MSTRIKPRPVTAARPKPARVSTVTKKSHSVRAMTRAQARKLGEPGQPIEPVRDKDAIAVVRPPRVEKRAQLSNATPESGGQVVNMDGKRDGDKVEQARPRDPYAAAARTLFGTVSGGVRRAASKVHATAPKLLQTAKTFAAETARRGADVAIGVGSRGASELSRQLNAARPALSSRQEPVVVRPREKTPDFTQEDEQRRIAEALLLSKTAYRDRSGRSNDPSVKDRSVAPPVYDDDAKGTNDVSDDLVEKLRRFRVSAPPRPLPARNPSTPSAPTLEELERRADVSSPDRTTASRPIEQPLPSSLSRQSPPAPSSSTPIPPPAPQPGTGTPGLALPVVGSASGNRPRTKEDDAMALVVYEPRVAPPRDKTTREDDGVVPASFKTDPQHPNFQSDLQRYLEGKWHDGKPPKTRAMLMDPATNACRRDPNAPKIPAPQQTAVHAFLQLMARTAPETRKTRGFLAWHSTGSGKTATTMAAIDAFWDAVDPDTGEPVKIVLATSVENRANNTIEKIAEWAPMFRRFRNMDQSAAEAAVAHRVEPPGIMTFTMLAHLVGVHRPKLRTRPSYLRNAVVIMDEVQNLFHPSPTYAEENRALLSLLQTRRDPVRPEIDASGAYTVILSATPGDSVADILALVNMIKDPQAPTIRHDSPATFFRGLVSFADFTGDLSAYPDLAPALQHLTPMSPDQDAEFVRVARTTVYGSRDRVDFLGRLQQISNNVPFDKYADDRLQATTDLPRLSPKFAQILHYVSTPEKHFVYSRFYNRHGIGDLERVLRAHGYSRFRAGDNTPGPRYIVLGGKEVEDQEGDERALRAVRDVFNSPANARGAIVQIILASRKYNEGLDLKGVRHVHIVEPQPTKNAEKQLIARAVRYCSHDQLDKPGDWNVTVHRYFSTESMMTRRATEATKGMTKERLDRALDSAKQRVKNAEHDLRLPDLSPAERKALETYKKVAATEIWMLERRAVAGAADAEMYSIARSKNDLEMETLLQTLREVAVDCRYMLPVHNDRRLMSAAGRKLTTCRYGGE